MPVKTFFWKHPGGGVLKKNSSEIGFFRVFWPLSI